MAYKHKYKSTYAHTQTHLSCFKSEMAAFASERNKDTFPIRSSRSTVVVVSEARSSLQRENRSSRSLCGRLCTYVCDCAAECVCTTVCKIYPILSVLFTCLLLHFLSFHPSHLRSALCTSTSLLLLACAVSALRKHACASSPVWLRRASYLRGRIDIKAMCVLLHIESKPVPPRLCGSDALHTCRMQIKM